jgi:hypothetical protein
MGVWAMAMTPDVLLVPAGLSRKLSAPATFIVAWYGEMTPHQR